MPGPAGHKKDCHPIQKTVDLDLRVFLYLNINKWLPGPIIGMYFIAMIF